MTIDVAIIGAGAAGLSAARELSGAGMQVCIIEARERIGGRVLTHHHSDLPVPIELGAEFVHGEAAATFRFVDGSALAACQLPDNHWWSANERWKLVDFWERVDRVQRMIGSLRRDMSFAAFLRTRRSLSPRLREIALGFVEGYHAAHADRISALALSTADQEQDDGGNKQFRILGGYDALIERLRAGLHPERTELRLGTTVTVIRWRRGAVEIETQGGRAIRAKKALLTIPIGVWKAAPQQEGAIRFDPPLTSKMRAIAKLEVGHVVKIVFRFRERFWDDPAFLLRTIGRTQGDGLPLNFVHSSDRFVPTWWTSAPVRSPLLTGWAGGHAADAMLAEGKGAMVDRALDSLARVFRMRRRTLDTLLAAHWTHDWQRDPFSRGAYSYAAVGGRSAHGALGRPVESTLFFAGEATSSDQTGTVAGAIESGQRAAKEMARE